jgi:TolB protein
MRSAGISASRRWTTRAIAMMSRLLVRAALATGVALLPIACGSSGGSSGRSDLAFVSSRQGAYAIYVMTATGSRQRRLTPGAVAASSSPRRLFFQVDPAWSPDGRSMAFASSRDGSSHIFVMKANGSGTSRLTSTKADDVHPSWSPDGKSIVFARGKFARIYVIGRNGLGLRRLTDDGAWETTPSWSPDGRWIAYVRRQPGQSIREIWLVRPDGSERHQLTRLGASTYSPTWSPDGKQLAFSSNVRGGRWKIYKIGVDGHGLRRVTRSPDDDFEPSWSPDGKTIAFARGGSIVSVNANGVRTLTEASGNDSSPAWRPVAR